MWVTDIVYMSVQSLAPEVKPARRGFGARGWVAIVVTAIVALFRIARTAHVDDAAQYWMMADRLAGSGEPFYVGAVDHKGPIWVGLFRLARMVTASQDWFWFLIAVQVVAFAGVLVWGTRWLAREAFGERSIAAVIAGVVAALSLFGPELYSQTLFGRNITSAFTVIAVVLIVRATRTGAQRMGWSSFIAAGLLMGLATQTVLTTAFATAALCLGIFVLSDSKRSGFRRCMILGVASLIAFASAAAWYNAIGAGDAFQLYFWDYNRIYANVGAESLADWLVTAVVETSRFHLGRRYPMVVPIAMVMLATMLWRSRATLRWTRRNRLLAFTVIWWCGELVSVAAPGRFYSHYWILQLVPGALIVAFAWVMLFVRFNGSGTSHAVQTRRAESGLGRFHHFPLALKLMFVPLVAVIGITVPSIVSGAGELAGFRGGEQHAAERDADWASPLGSVRAIVNASIGPDEPIYGWVQPGEFYAAMDRPAATRFDRRNWLTGAINDSPERVQIPGVWDATMADLEDSQPSVFVELLDEPVESGTPLWNWTRENFTPIYESEATLPVRVWLRSDLAAQPPVELLYASQPGTEADVLCWDVAPQAELGGIQLLGSRQFGFFQVENDVVLSFRQPLRQTESADAVAEVVAPQISDTLLLQVTDTSALLWDGPMVVGALDMPLGIDDVVFVASLEGNAKSRTC